jgi:hypothetical protein
VSNRIELSATLNVQAADEATTPTFQLVAYTGAAIRQGWSRNPLVVDLAQIDASRPIPILYAHGKEMPLLDSVIGKSVEASNDGSQLLLSGEFRKRVFSVLRQRNIFLNRRHKHVHVGSDSVISCTVPLRAFHVTWCLRDCADYITFQNFL